MAAILVNFMPGQQAGNAIADVPANEIPFYKRVLAGGTAGGISISTLRRSQGPTPRQCWPSHASPRSFTTGLCRGDAAALGEERRVRRERFEQRWRGPRSP